MLLLLAFVCLLLLQVAHAQVSLRCVTFGKHIGESENETDIFEPSAMTYDPLTESLVMVGDEGRLTTFPRQNLNEDSMHSPVVGFVGNRDFESVTYFRDGLVFIGQEYPPMLVLYDLEENVIQQDNIELAEVDEACTSPTLCIESLAYVQYANRTKGHLYIGVEGNGLIYVYEFEGSTATLTNITSPPSPPPGPEPVPTTVLTGIHEPYFFLLTANPPDYLSVFLVNDTTGLPEKLVSQAQFPEQASAQGIVALPRSSSGSLGNKKDGLWDIYVALDVSHFGTHFLYNITSASFVQCLDDPMIRPPPSSYNWTLFLGLLFGLTFSACLFGLLLALILTLIFCCICVTKAKRELPPDVDETAFEMFLMQWEVNKTKRTMSWRGQSGGKFDFASQLRVDPDMLRRLIVPLDDIELISILGGNIGSDSCVYLAKMRSKSELVVFKYFLDLSKDVAMRFIAEFNALCVTTITSHPSIIKFHGCVLETRMIDGVGEEEATVEIERLGLCIEYAEGGDLSQFIKKNKEITPATKIRMLKEVASGMEFLHKKGILHRDLKPQNLLLTHAVAVKIIDFGLSRLSAAGFAKTQRIGTSYWMAPELLLGAEYDEKIDVFAFSIIIFQLLTHTNDPYAVVQEGFSRVELRVANDPTFRPSLDRIDPELLRRYDFDWLIRLMERGWSHNASDRPSFHELLTAIAEKEEKFRPASLPKPDQHDNHRSKSLPRDQQESGGGELNRRESFRELSGLISHRPESLDSIPTVPKLKPPNPEPQLLLLKDQDQDRTFPCVCGESGTLQLTSQSIKWASAEDQRFEILYDCIEEYGVVEDHDLTTVYFQERSLQSSPPKTVTVRMPSGDVEEFFTRLDSLFSLDAEGPLTPSSSSYEIVVED